MNKFNYTPYLAVLFFSAALCSYGHEGAEYPESVRHVLANQEDPPNGIRRGNELELEILTSSSKATQSMRIEAHQGLRNWDSPQDLFPQKVSSKVGELEIQSAPESDQKIKYFTDGHIYEISTHLVEFTIPGSEKSHQVRIDSKALEKLSFESNSTESWLMVRDVFDDSSTIVIDDEKIFVPCSVCINAQSGNRVITPFRSYEIGELNDFFDGGVAWRWFGENYLVAQLLVTENKFGMNSIKERRIYLFNVSAGKLHAVDTKLIDETLSEMGDGAEVDFDAEPIQLTVLPVKVLHPDSGEENLLMRMKPKR